MSYVHCVHSATFNKTVVSPTGTKKIATFYETEVSLQGEKNCPSYETWARLQSENVNLHVKNFNILHLHEIHAPTFFMNKVALDSQFYNGDIKSYLLPLCLVQKKIYKKKFLYAKY